MKPFKMSCNMPSIPELYHSVLEVVTMTYLTANDANFICSDKPFNPLVTSGGILSASLLLQLVKPELDDLARKYEYVQNIFEVTFQFIKLGSIFLVMTVS
jgi:hypothetical protein